MKIICRICNAEKGEFYALDSELYLDETSVTISLVDILKENLKLNVDLTDNLPQTLCLECCTYLKSLYKFILLAQKSDKEFRDISYNNSDNYCDDDIDGEANLILSDDITHVNDVTIKCENDELIEIGTTMVENLYQEHELEEDLMYYVKGEDPQIENDNIGKNPYVLLNNNECESEWKEFHGNNSILEFQHLRNTASNNHRLNKKDVLTYSCKYCYKNFSGRASLKAHINSHSNKKPYQCSICAETFQESTTLKSHMSLHLGKTIQCHICQKRFSRPGHLNIHLREHNNDNQRSSSCTPPLLYKCEQCDESFMKQQQLKRHINKNHSTNNNSAIIASGNPPIYERSKLGKFYNKKVFLTPHMKEEQKTRTTILFCCKECNMEFLAPNELFQHIKLKHPETNCI